jgi:hypothetical protein
LTAQPQGTGFKDLVDPSLWKDYDTYVKEADGQLEKDVVASLEIRKKLREELLQDPEFKNKIRPKKEERKKWEETCAWAEQELYGGNVAAVDGTIANFPMISGKRCRIGIVATSYKNNRIEKVLYVSERQLVEPSLSAKEHYQNLAKTSTMSNMLLRALMLYGERDLALKRPERWKFVHGELLPYELRTGLGIYEALPETLELGRKLINAKNVISVIEDTKRPTLMAAGTILNKGEFMDVFSLKDELLTNFLDGHHAHFNKEDEKYFRDFVEGYCDNIRFGMFKVGQKPYVINAHKEVFDKAMALVMRDAASQQIRGFPLLIDYADNICGTTLSGADFQKQVMFKIANLSPDSLGFEITARKTRRK